MRGGKREGSGRKKGEATKTIRIPESLVDEVKALIERHKNKKVQNEKSNKNQITILSKQQLVLLQQVMVNHGSAKSKTEARKLTNSHNKCKNEFLKIVHQLKDNDFESIKEIAKLYRID